MDLDRYIDEAPLNAFHRKLTLFCSGGPFLDGYALTIIGLAFITMKPALGLTPTEIGMVGSAALVGILVGGGVFGYLTDRIGWHVMYVLDLVALVVTSLACAFVTDAWQLIVLRFLLGIAVGADYPIASSLLVEFLPSKKRGFYLGALFVVWGVGAFAAALVAWALSPLGEDAWRWMLASSAIPGILTIYFRAGTPESPRWLLSKGRVDEARQVLRQVYGDEVDVATLRAEEKVAKTSFATLFRGPYFGRTVFVSVFFTMQVIPLFAVYTFGPELLEGMGLPVGWGTYLAEAIIGALFVIGGVPGLLMVDSIGRKSLLIWSFTIMTLTFGLMGMLAGAAPLLLLALLGIYCLVSGASNFLEIVYPNELFPTEVRATATGVVTAASRIGSAISTFLLPLLLHDYGIGVTMFCLAAVNVIGLVVTLALGVETKGRPLGETAGEGSASPHFPLAAREVVG